jgi:DNA-binding CsgD family transcriptional regulator
MTDRQEDIDRLILDIHAAPLETDRWQHVVESVCRLVGAEQALLFSVPQSRGLPFWNISFRMNPEVTAEYAAEFAPEDVWMLEVSNRRATRPGTIFTGEELIDRRRYLGTRFFNEFLVRHDIDRFMNLALLPSASPRAPAAAAFSFYRGCGKDAFTHRARETLGRLTPHLISAFNSFLTIQALSLHNSALTKSVDAVSVPLFIVDMNRRVIFANEVAETLDNMESCLRITKGRLVPSPMVRERKTCQNALASVVLGRSAMVRLTVGPSGRKFILSTVPACESNRSLASWGSAAGIVWYVPVQSTCNAAKRIAALFALTIAEEKLLNCLSVGNALGAAADALRISIHTARSQLKSIQRKTGWHTQTELVRMVEQLGSIDPKASR